MNSNATMLLLLLPLLLPSSLPSPLPPPVLSLLSSGPLRCWGVCAARASAPRGRVRREGVCAARACAPRGPLHKKRAGPPEQAGNSGRCLRLEGVWGASPRGRGAFAHVNLHPSSATLRSASTLQQAEQTCNTRRRRCGACERSLQPAHF